MLVYEEIMIVIDLLPVASTKISDDERAVIPSCNFQTTTPLEDFTVGLVNSDN